jgi:hypothetical protein
MKRDVSNVRVMSEALNLNHEDTALIVACGNENFGLIENKLKFLSDKLQIQNVNALKNIISLSLGNIEPLREIMERNPKFLTEDQFELLLALLNIANQGFRRRRYKTAIDFNKIYSNSKTIAERLMKVFKIDKGNMDNNNTSSMNNEGGDDREEHKTNESPYDQEENKSINDPKERSIHERKKSMTKVNDSGEDVIKKEVTIELLNSLVLMGMNDNTSIGKIGDLMIKCIESKY